MKNVETRSATKPGPSGPGGRRVSPRAARQAAHSKKRRTKSSTKKGKGGSSGGGGREWGSRPPSHGAANAGIKQRLAYDAAHRRTRPRRPVRSPTTERRGPYRGPRQPHKPRIRRGSLKGPGPADYSPNIGSIGRQLVSSIKSGPQFTFGDPTIASRDKLKRELDLRDGVNNGVHNTTKGISMTQVPARPKSPRLSPRFPEDAMAVFHDPLPGPGAYNAVDSLHITKRTAPAIGFGTSSRMNAGSYLHDVAFADSAQKAELDRAVDADIQRTKRAVVALRYGLQAQTPGYTGGLKNTSERVTVAEAARAKVDPAALLLHPWLRREVITRKVKQNKQQHTEPGPGRYNVNMSVIKTKSPRVGMPRAARTLKTTLVDDAGPGPAAYNTELYGATGRSQAKSSIRNSGGIKFGSEKRPGGYDEWHSAPELTGPGPGDYDPHASITMGDPVSGTHGVVSIASHSGYTFGAASRNGQHSFLPQLRSETPRA